MATAGARPRVFVRSDQSFLSPADLVTRTRTPITPVEYVLSQKVRTRAHANKAGA